MDNFLKMAVTAVQTTSEWKSRPRDISFMGRDAQMKRRCVQNLTLNGRTKRTVLLKTRAHKIYKC
jgi:hypothetical protein